MLLAAEVIRDGKEIAANMASTTWWSTGATAG